MQLGAGIGTGTRMVIALTTDQYYTTNIYSPMDIRNRIEDLSQPGVYGWEIMEPFIIINKEI